MEMMPNTETNIASLEQAKEIYNHFYKNLEWFPHIRMDWIQTNLKRGNVIYEDGVIIIWKTYKRKNKFRNSDCTAERGDRMLHQILNTVPGNGKGGEVMRKFFLSQSTPVWLSVRKDNATAVRSYLRNGMKLVGSTSWMSGTMPGLVFRWDSGLKANLEAYYGP